MLARFCSLRVLAAVLPLSAGCSLYIQDVLDQAANNVVAEGEGEASEGEGEVAEGEGEVAEGEGEGEVIDDDDPACEENERLVIVRDDSVDVLQVYDLAPGRFVRHFPEGNAGNVNLENDDPAVGNGFGVDAFALGTAGRLYLTGGSFLYQIDTATLTQENIAAKPQMRIGDTATTVQVTGTNIVIAGSNIQQVVEGAGVGVVPTVFNGPNDNYHRSVKFSVAGEDFVAINSRFGYVVLSSTGANLPTPTVVYDEDFAENRFHEYVGGNFQPRGIAFDATTRNLLLADIGRVIVVNHATGFSIGDPDDDAGDFVLPPGSETRRIQAIATRGGFAWILLDRGIDNLMKLDLSQSPPVAADVTTVDTDGGFGRSLTVGCRRIVVGSFTKLIAVARADLSPIATLAIADLEQVAIVPKSAIGGP